MWCASSVSMNFVVRASGSKPDSASALSWNLPSRSVKYVNMKNASQSGVCLVERAEDARVVGVAGAALKQRLGFLAAVAAEVAMQEVHHRPQVAAFLHVDLEQVAQVVQRRAVSPRWRCCSTDAGSVSPCVTMMPAQVRAMLARHVLPRGLAHVLAEVDLAIRRRRG